MLVSYKRKSCSLRQFYQHALSIQWATNSKCIYNVQIYLYLLGEREVSTIFEEKSLDGEILQCKWLDISQAACIALGWFIDIISQYIYIVFVCTYQPKLLGVLALYRVMYYVRSSLVAGNVCKSHYHIQIVTLVVLKHVKIWHLN